VLGRGVGPLACVWLSHTSVIRDKVGACGLIRYVPVQAEESEGLDLSGEAATGAVSIEVKRRDLL
jgi:hypothetical protein